MAEDDTVAQLAALPSAFVTDAMRRLGLSGWSEGVHPLSRAARRMAGRAVTLRYEPKREGGPKAPSVYEVIRQASPGDVLVFAGRATPCWLIGENFCHDAHYHGLAGFAVDGCVRDADEIAEMPMPVFCRGAGIRPWRGDLDLVAVGVTVSFAGMQVRPGDIVVGDGDGLAVLPPDRAGEALAAAREIADLEKDKEAAIARRAPLDELLRMSAAKKATDKPRG